MPTRWLFGLDEQNTSRHSSGWATIEGKLSVESAQAKDRASVAIRIASAAPSRLVCAAANRRWAWAPLRLSRPCSGSTLVTGFGQDPPPRGGLHRVRRGMAAGRQRASLTARRTAPAAAQGRHWRRRKGRRAIHNGRQIKPLGHPAAPVRRQRVTPVAGINRKPCAQNRLCPESTGLAWRRERQPHWIS